MPIAFTDQPVRGTRLFANTADLDRARRATDFILLVTSLTGLLFVAVAARPEPSFVSAITDFVEALPAALTGMWQLFAGLPVVWGLVILALAVVRGRKSVARDMVFAVVVAALLWFIISRIVEGRGRRLALSSATSRRPRPFPLRGSAFLLRC